MKMGLTHGGVRNRKNNKIYVWNRYWTEEELFNGYVEALKDNKQPRFAFLIQVPARRDRITEYFGCGCVYSYAAEKCGCSPATIREDVELIARYLQRDNSTRQDKLQGVVGLDMRTAHGIPDPTAWEAAKNLVTEKKKLDRKHNAKNFEERGKV